MIENADETIHALLRQQIEAQRALKQSLINLERNRIRDEKALEDDYRDGRYTEVEYEIVQRTMQERYESERVRLLKN